MSLDPALSPAASNIISTSADEDPNVFYFYENWTDRAALDVHLNLPYQKEWFGRHDEFLSRKVELRFFTMLSDYDK